MGLFVLTNYATNNFKSLSRGLVDDEDSPSPHQIRFGRSIRWAALYTSKQG